MFGLQCTLRALSFLASIISFRIIDFRLICVFVVHNIFKLFPHPFSFRNIFRIFFFANMDIFVDYQEMKRCCQSMPHESSAADGAEISRDTTHYASYYFASLPEAHPVEAVQVSFVPPLKMEEESSRVGDMRFGALIGTKTHLRACCKMLSHLFPSSRLSINP